MLAPRGHALLPGLLPGAPPRPPSSPQCQQLPPPSAALTGCRRSSLSASASSLLPRKEPEPFPLAVLSPSPAALNPAGGPTTCHFRTGQRSPQPSREPPSTTQCSSRHSPTGRACLPAPFKAPVTRPSSLVTYPRPIPALSVLSFLDAPPLEAVGLLARASRRPHPASSQGRGCQAEAKPLSPSRGQGLWPCSCCPTSPPLPRLRGLEAPALSNQVRQALLSRHYAAQGHARPCPQGVAGSLLPRRPPRPAPGPHWLPPLPPPPPSWGRGLEVTLEQLPTGSAQSWPLPVLRRPLSCQGPQPALSSLRDPGASLHGSDRQASRHLPQRPPRLRPGSVDLLPPRSLPPSFLSMYFPPASVRLAHHQLLVRGRAPSPSSGPISRGLPPELGPRPLPSVHLLPGAPPSSGRRRRRRARA